MPTLSWKDDRLGIEDTAPFDTTVLLTSANISISELVRSTEDWCKSLPGIEKNLMIYCHGSPGYLQICKEGLRYNNLTSLFSLKPYFDSVDVHACEIAKGQIGRTFCIKLAQTLNAPVAGATALQTNTGPWKMYYWEDDSKYDGNFYMHSPTGKVTGPFTSNMPAIVHPSVF